MRVLLTGMSGTGKSTLIRELQRRGFVAYDADDDGFSEARESGRWGWRRELVTDRSGNSRRSSAIGPRSSRCCVARRTRP